MCAEATTGEAAAHLLSGMAQCGSVGSFGNALLQGGSWRRNPAPCHSLQKVKGGEEEQETCVGPMDLCQEVPARAGRAKAGAIQQ